MNHLKVGSLASSLGYDISYVSKWISGAKLPSMKNNDALMRNIACFFTANATPEGKEAMEAQFFQGIPVEDEQALESALEELLFQTYRGGKQIKEENASLYNCLIRPKNYNGDSASFLEEGLMQACRNQNGRPLEIITMVPFQMNDNKNLPFYDELNNGCPKTRPVRIRQTVYMKGMREHLDVYCRCICTFMWYSENVTYEFYDVDFDTDQSNYAFIIKDGLLILNMGSCITPLKNTPICLMTSDEQTVSSYYNIISHYLHSRQQLIYKIDPKNAYNNNLVLSFLLGKNGRYLIRDMVPLFMSSRMLCNLAEQYIPDPETRKNYIRLSRLSFLLPKQVIIYKAVLIDYIVSGRLHIFGKTVVLTQEERAEHLHYILDCFRQFPGNELIILDDVNPILQFQDAGVSVFLSDSACFAIRDGEEKVDGMYHFRSKELIECFNQFFDHLAGVPGDYQVTGEAAFALIGQLLENVD
ncbi:MAG: hypothetical protein LUE23_10370 [Lachnospiraceae bacterium]|nr:hypothetical protein [Lachnospiraceae bacterium]